MHPVVNTDQSEAWNGYEGNHWAEHQERYDAVNSGFNPPLLAAAAIGETDRVLDIGCGNGQLTRLAARRAARGQATGIDLSAPMLARARASAVDEGVANVTFVRGDAQVYPFTVDSYDVAVSRFGIMFFSDPVAAFANIGRTLRPGGRLAFVSMRDAGDLGPVLAAMSRHVPQAAAAQPDGSPSQPAAAQPETSPAPANAAPAAGSDPLSLADPTVIRHVLGDAGFIDIAAEAVDATQVWGRDGEDAGAFLAGWGPVRYLLGQHDEVAAGQARAALTSVLRSYQDADGVRLRGTAWLVTAVRPS